MIHRCNRNDAVLAIISEWTFAVNAYCNRVIRDLVHLYKFAIPNYFANVQSIFIYLFSSEFIFTDIIHVQYSLHYLSSPAVSPTQRWMIFDWYICTHYEKIRNNVRERESDRECNTSSHYAVKSWPVEIFAKQRIALCDADIRLLTRLMIFAARLSPPLNSPRAILNQSVLLAGWWGDEIFAKYTQRGDSDRHIEHVAVRRGRGAPEHICNQLLHTRNTVISTSPRTLT